MFGPAVWWYIEPRIEPRGAGCAMGRVLHGSATTTKDGPSRDPAPSRKRENGGRALWRQSDDYSEVA
jgi:hypothetical protein